MGSLEKKPKDKTQGKMEKLKSFPHILTELIFQNDSNKRLTWNGNLIQYFHMNARIHIRIKSLSC